MHSLFALTILVAIFSLAECEKNYPYTIRENSLELTNYYNLRSANCKGMSVAKKQTKCASRPMLVNLTPDPDYVFDPPMIHVNRCAGDCEFNICSPTKSEYVTRVVRRYKRNSDWIHNIECVAFEIEEHKNCSCMCRTTADNCHKNQTYDDRNCKCICPNQMENKIKCEKQMGMQWMENICDCKCMMMIHECSSGTKWDHFTCKCVND